MRFVGHAKLVGGPFWRDFFECLKGRSIFVEDRFSHISQSLLGFLPVLVRGWAT